MAALSEQEIQKRIKLGLVVSGPPNDNDSEDVELEDWQDIPDEVDQAKGVESDGSEDFAFDTKRRPSIDLENMSFNSHDQECEASAAATAGLTASYLSPSFHGDTYDPNKRLRARKPLVASITEEELLDAVVDDEEIATVDGDDEADDMELYRDTEVA